MKNMPIPLSSILWMGQLAIRPSCKKPQLSRGYPASGRGGKRTLREVFVK